MTHDGVHALKFMVVGQGPSDLGMPCLLLVLGIGETSASEGEIPVSITTIFLRFTESSRHLACHIIKTWEVTVGFPLSPNKLSLQA